MSERRPIAAVCNDLERLLSQPLNEAEPALELAGEVGAHPDGVKAVGLLLLLLERNPHLDWGAPGAMVHAAERFFGRGYEPLLLESLRRSPTRHTLWMANRLVNGLPRDSREGYLSAIRDVSESEAVPDEVRQLARRYLAFQAARG